MKTIDTLALRHRLLLAVASALLLNGCVTISDPIEEPSPIPPSPTVEEAAFLAAQPASTPLPNQAPNFLGVSDPKRNSPTPTPSPTPQAIATVHTVGEWENMRWISEKYAVSVEAIMAANGMTDPDKIVVGQQLNIPSANQIVQAMVATGTPIPIPRDESGHILHFIQAGETLSGIAEQYDISRDDLLFANGLRPDSLIMAGGTLIIPQGEYTPVPTATPLGPTPVPTLIVALEPSPTSEASPTIVPTQEPVTYTVQAGDRAGAIARDNGITVPLLASANPGANMDALSVGQVLVIPSAPEAEGSATATSNTVEPTATPTEVPPVIVTHVVTEGENWKSIGEKYGVSEDVLKAANPSVTAEPEMDSAVQVPIGTPTPTPSPTAPPTMTPTPAPAFAAPVLLLPANDTAATYRENMQPIHLLWTSTGILRQNEFYVARLRAVDGAGDVLWTETYWTQGPSWRLEEELLGTIAGTVTLRWDVMVMRRTSEAGEEPATGTALSEKSPTYEIVFTGPLPAPEVTSTSVESSQAAPTRTRTATPTRTPTRTPSSSRRP